MTTTADCKPRKQAPETVVKRWDSTAHKNPTMEWHPNGAYVMYSDYAALEKRVEELGGLLKLSYENFAAQFKSYKDVREERDRLLDTVTINAGVEFDDERLRCVVLQVDREDWLWAKSLRGGEE